MTPAELVRQALAEDIGRGDLFAACVAAAPGRAHLLTKESGVFAGRLYAEELAAQTGLQIRWSVEDGMSIKAGDLLADVAGDRRVLLAAERTLLNLLQHASGIATNARRYLQELEGARTVLLDTRKTRPGLRAFEKYAARVGGCRNHRMGLDDCLMLKDTHRGMVESMEALVAEARRQIPFTTSIEIECATLDEVIEAARLGAQIAMCDNMEPEEVAEVVAWRNAHAPSLKLEASGNITLATLKAYAATGVDALSSGSIIHQAVWLDFSMKSC